MVQFRRLDPLANASPYQRLLKSPVKSFTLSESQYDYVSKERPELLVTFGEAALICLTNHEYLEVHYAYPDVAGFRDNFVEMFKAAIVHSSKDEAPRGVLLSFRDRPNRSVAQTVFWTIAMEEGQQWVEMNQIAVPEQPEPSADLGDGYTISEATDADLAAIAALEAASCGQQPLSERGLASLKAGARWLHVVRDAGGAAVGYLALNLQPGGWGIIQDAVTRPEVADALRKPLLDWSIAFLRNHGGRRVRSQVYTDDVATVALLRDNGFTPGETGVEFGRPVDEADIQAKIDERQSHGTLIKFGDWR